MSQDKSREKSALVAIKCTKSANDVKLSFFRQLVKSCIKENETRTSFMNRIGLGQQRAMYNEYYKGTRMVTPVSFDIIRTSLEWDG